jgi:hypothetical protein
MRLPLVFTLALAILVGLALLVTSMGGCGSGCLDADQPIV